MSEPAITFPAGSPDPVIQQTFNLNDQLPAPPHQVSPQFFTADQVEAIRQQEKDKLYGRLSKQQDELTAFRQQLDTLSADKTARDQVIADAQKAKDDAERQAREEKLSAQQLIEAREAELKKQQDDFQAQMSLQVETMKKEHEFLRLQSFTQRRVAEEIAANTIIPDLVEYIGGNTEDEVEASITKAKEKTANIVRGATSLGTPSIPVGGVSPTAGPSGPLDNLSAPKQLSLADLQAMPMDQWAQYRRQTGLDRAGNGQGLFG